MVLFCFGRRRVHQRKTVGRYLVCLGPAALNPLTDTIRRRVRWVKTGLNTEPQVLRKILALILCSLPLLRGPCSIRFHLLLLVDTSPMVINELLRPNRSLGLRMLIPLSRLPRRILRRALLLCRRDQTNILNLILILRLGSMLMVNPIRVRKLTFNQLRILPHTRPIHILSLIHMDQPIPPIPHLSSPTIQAPLTQHRHQLTVMQHTMSHHPQGRIAIMFMLILRHMPRIRMDNIQYILPIRHTFLLLRHHHHMSLT